MSEAIMNAAADRVPVVQVQDLTKTFRQSDGTFRGKNMLTAVDHISFNLYRGEILGLLGESGCGKTTLARMLMHLIAPTSGKIFLGGREVQGMPERKFRKLRGDIQMVYQNPFDCLDPMRRIRSLLEESMKIWHPEMSAGERLEKILAMLAECGLGEESLKKHPKEFSGGQLQRISIARALLAEPKVLIADEIVSALDVPIQNQILQLLRKMKEEHHLTVLFITHDLSVAKKMSDRIMVMQSGEIKGIGAPEELLGKSDDPYIRDLAKAVFTFAGEG